MSKKIAILATDGFEQSELLEPQQHLKDQGFTPEVVSLKSGTIKAWKDKDWGQVVPVDKTLDQARPEDYEALVLPGGVINPDLLRVEPKAVEFVKAFVTAGKPVAAICHGPIMLIEAGAVKGRKMTSYKAIKTDMINAGANWVDEAVVCDQGLVTSRQPSDLKAFNAKLVEEIREGAHARR
jgi:protease I